MELVLLDHLNDDILLLILSFVAELPFEDSTLSKEANVTHFFPFINKRFYRLCYDYDYLWRVSVERLIKSNDEIWGKYLTERIRKKGVIQCYRHLYQETFRNDVNIRMPLLYDTSNQYIPETGIAVGDEIDIYVSKRHHYTFLSKVLKQNTATDHVSRYGSVFIPREHFAGSNSNVKPLKEPTFLYLNQPEGGDFSTNYESDIIIAPKMRIVECILYSDNSAHLSLIAESFERVQAIWEIPSSDGQLYNARILKCRTLELETLDKKKSWFKKFALLCSSFLAIIACGWCIEKSASWQYPASLNLAQVEVGRV